MQTKLSRILDGLLESVWLAVVIIVPLFFNVFSSRIFEPDKIAILRTLSLILLGAWVVKIIEEGGIRWENVKRDGSVIKTIGKIPLLIPVLAFGIVYGIATILSISPSISFFGSYQRMQGFYTTLSYLVIFFAIIVNLRKQAQVDRLISAIIVTSLPIALYGVLQRYGLDPVPWEGNVSIRIASTMGNSIFIAAYIIMVFPLTMGRIIEHFRAIVDETGQLIIHMISASLYVFIAILQVIALYLSQSRGPALGWLASSVFLVLFLFTLYQRKWLTTSLLVLIVLFGAFLVLINIENGPLEQLRNSPAIGRFGRLLDPESNSALVRRYIWEGTAQLVSPHEPLVYPDGSTDSLNAIRPLIGYGPESMFVVYNPFYVPELGRVEKRNASPDRSHNETWDALVRSGGIGLIVYIGLFGSIFYFGFKWLGLLYSRNEKLLFGILATLGGVIGLIIAGVWRGLPYWGIGLPFGIVFGIFLFLVYKAILLKNPPRLNELGIERYILLAVLFTSIIAHFMEINFGIAIVATRTYFWFFTALLFVVGYIYSLKFEFDLSSNTLDYLESDRKSVQSGDNKSSRKSNKHIERNRSWLREGWVSGIILGLILATLGYNLIGNARNLGEAFGILWASMTELGGGESSGILIMIVTTWIVSGVLLSLRIFINHKPKPSKVSREAFVALLFILGVSLLIGGTFWIWHATGLATLASASINSLEDLLAQVEQYENIFSRFIIYLIGIVVLQAILIVRSRKEITNRENYASPRGIIASIIIFPLVIWIANLTNIQMVQADIDFRLANSFTRPGQWPAAIEIFGRANQLAPREDYYYLSLAGAYFEQAKTIAGDQDSEELLSKVEEDLLRAQKLSPLNTDHTANLARLYNIWGAFTADPEMRLERLQKSSNYYSTAVTLSPNNPRLWSEWALLNLSSLDRPDEALKLLMKALEVDPEYDWAHGLLADYYVRSARKIEDETEKVRLLNLATEEYQKAIDRVKYYEAQHLPGYVMASASIYVQLEEYERAIEFYELALDKKYASEDWQIEEALAKLYYEIGEIQQALVYAEAALSNAPQDQVDRISNLLNQIENAGDQ